MSPGRATAVYVAFRTTTIDLSWIPDDAEVIVVHHDDMLEVAHCQHPHVRHLRIGENHGFGRGVNAALQFVETERTVVCNPDTHLQREHWSALAAGSPDELLAVSLVDGSGAPTSLINRYPTPLSLLLTGFRPGRLLHRKGRIRRMLEPMLGRWGVDHQRLRKARSGTWPLATHWLSGALFSADTARLRTVHGFDPGYFLYVEDVDLCSRLATRFPGMRIRMAATAPGVHAVGGSSATRVQRHAVDWHYLRSLRRYGHDRRGVGWRVAVGALAVPELMLRRPANRSLGL